MKLYWKIKNFIEVLFAKRESPGLLTHKNDVKDFKFGGGVKSNFLSYSIGPQRWIFDQFPMNCCVFASNTMASSYQEGMRFSVRFAVAVARKKGYISGNGFSYLRAGFKIATQVGRLPYEYLPDEIAGMTWEQYSRVPITEEMLKVASQYKAPNYQLIQNTKDALEALEAGYVLLTASQWYSAMNTPEAPLYLLQQRGSIIGGHAWLVHEFNGNFENPQTFGFLYGKEGKAFVDNLFKAGHYAVYIQEKLPGRTDVDRTKDVFEGSCVKGSGDAIYKIENGLKRHFTSGESFKQYGESFNIIPDSVLVEIKDGLDI